MTQDIDGPDREPRETNAMSSNLPGPSRSFRVATVGTFVLLLFAALYFTRDFVLPIVIALILALTLRPIVRFGARRHIPPVITAVVLTAGLIAGLILATYAVFLPVMDWIDDAPKIGQELKDKLASLRGPVEAIAEAEAEIDEVTATAADQQRPRAVIVEGPGFFSTAASGLLSLAAMLGISSLLLAFFLASGDLFYVKIVQSFERLKDKKRILQILRDIEREISRYLLTVVLINAGLGVAVGVGFYILGMPSAHIWGVVAALANFMPYIGGILGVAAAAVVAVVTFDTLTYALLIPAYYAVCTTIEGQFVTPFVVGKRLQLNIVAVFIAVAFWAWLWGIVGALIAVPLLVIFKTVCDHVASLNSFGNFLTSAGSGTADGKRTPSTPKN